MNSLSRLEEEVKVHYRTRHSGFSVVVAVVVYSFVLTFSTHFDIRSEFMKILYVLLHVNLITDPEWVFFLPLC